MVKQKLGKGPATLLAPGTAILATPAAKADDQTGSAMRIEESRYERAILDFESAVRRERDRMSAEHLENQRVILAEAAE